MNHAKCSVAVLDAVGDNPQGQQIKHLIDRDSLFLQLDMNGIQTFHPGLDAAWDPMLFHLFFHQFRNFRKKRFVGLALSFDDFLEFLISLRVQIAESEVFQFAPHFSHPRRLASGP